MAEILFYHLEHKSMDQVLPGLLEKCLERDWQVFVKANNDMSAKQIDKHLWQYGADKFLPHGLAKTPKNMRKGFLEDEYAALQPILIGEEDGRENDANILFLTQGSGFNFDDISHYQRVIVIFDGNHDQELSNARSQWKQFKAANQDLIDNQTYWQQNDMGQWQKKA